MSHSSKYIYAVIFRINFNTSNTVNTRKKSCVYQKNEKLYLIYYFHHIRHKFSFVLQWTDWKIIFLFSLKKREREKRNKILLRRSAGLWNIFRRQIIAFPFSFWLVFLRVCLVDIFGGNVWLFLSAVCVGSCSGWIYIRIKNVSQTVILTVRRFSNIINKMKYWRNWVRLVGLTKQWLCYNVRKKTEHKFELRVSEIIVVLVLHVRLNKRSFIIKEIILVKETGLQ